MKDFVVEVLKNGIKKKNGDLCEKGELLYSKKLLMSQESVLLRIERGVLRIRDKAALKQYKKHGPDQEVVNATRDPKPLKDTPSNIALMTERMIAEAEHHVTKYDIDLEDEYIADDPITTTMRIPEPELEPEEEEEEDDYVEPKGDGIPRRWGMTKEELWDASDKNGNQRKCGYCQKSFKGRDALFKHKCEEDPDY